MNLINWFDIINIGGMIVFLIGITYIIIQGCYDEKFNINNVIVKVDSDKLGNNKEKLIEINKELTLLNEKFLEVKNNKEMNK